MLSQSTKSAEFQLESLGIMVKTSIIHDVSWHHYVRRVVHVQIARYRWLMRNNRQYDYDAMQTLEHIRFSFSVRNERN